MLTISHFNGNTLLVAAMATFCKFYAVGVVLLMYTRRLKKFMLLLWLFLSDDDTWLPQFSKLPKEDQGLLGGFHQETNSVASAATGSSDIGVVVIATR